MEYLQVIAFIISLFIFPLIGSSMVINGSKETNQKNISKKWLLAFVITLLPLLPLLYPQLFHVNI